MNNCYQSTCQLENTIVNGYGKTSSDSLKSGISNIIDSLIQEEAYIEAIKYCLKKITIDHTVNHHKHNLIGQNNTHNQQNSKKQLLSTEKTVKTQSSAPMSLEKKILTMSANLSSNSKDSSTKAKSIKDEIFEYFNLQNLTVKNPNQVSAINNISPILLGNKSSKSNLILSNQLNHSKSKDRYQPINSLVYKQNKNKHFNNLKDEKIRALGNCSDNQLQMVYNKIRQMQEKIIVVEKQNQYLKQQLLIKKKKTTNNQDHPERNSISENDQVNLNNHYFTRQSLQSKKPKSVISPSQSNKKLTSNNFQNNLTNFNGNNFNNEKTEIISKLKNNEKKENVKYETKGYLIENQQNEFQKIDMKDTITAKMSTNSKQINNHPQSAYTTINSNSYKKQQERNFLLVSQQSNINKNEQKRCLLDISNLTQSVNNSNINGYSKSEFSTIANNQFKNQSKHSNAFQTANNIKSPNNNVGLCLKKFSNNNDYLGSDKKLRSASVNNYLNQKISNQLGDKTYNNFNDKLGGQIGEKISSQLSDKLGTVYNNNLKNPICLINSTNLNSGNNITINNLNSSFDHNDTGPGVKKIKIPKLNLQILPNYHGKSNKSLNQSLLENYEKKNQLNTLQVQ